MGRPARSTANPSSPSPSSPASSSLSSSSSSSSSSSMPILPRLLHALWLILMLLGFAAERLFYVAVDFWLAKWTEGEDDILRASTAAESAALAAGANSSAAEAAGTQAALDLLNDDSVFVSVLWFQLPLSSLAIEWTIGFSVLTAALCVFVVFRLEFMALGLAHSS